MKLKKTILTLATLTAVTLVMFASQEMAMAQSPGSFLGIKSGVPIQQRIKSCTGCHGDNSYSRRPWFPHIAGQPADYLVTELKAIRAGKRTEQYAEYMQLAQQLSDDDINQIAQWYTKVTPIENSPGDPTLAARGKQIFENGITSGGLSIPACMACHGPDGHGMGVFPHIAAQPSGYLYRQLEAFQSGQRPETTLMPAIIRGMSEQDERAISEYLQGLK